MATIIGIDLGTTYSAVAHFDETGYPRIVANSEGQNLTPSCVAMIDGRLCAGEGTPKAMGAGACRSSRPIQAGYGHLGCAPHHWQTL